MRADTWQRRAFVYGAAVVFITLILRVMYGHGSVGYDAGYTLIWGSQLAHGALPSFEALFAPTPHPLSILEGAALSPLGDSAPAGIIWLSIVCFAALTAASFAIGRQLFTKWVGISFALLVVVTQPFLASTLQAVIDVQFLLFVMLAAVFAIPGRTGTERPMTAMGLLFIAGLLRPEAWALGAAYLVVLLLRKPPVQSRMALAALVLAAPIVWCLMDLVVTGDPLYSLHGTRELAAQLHRYRDGGTALKAGPAYLRLLLGPVVLLGGLAGVFVAIRWWREQSLALSAVLALSVLSFSVLGFAGLPLITRYLVVPAAIMGLFFCVALVGWISIPQDDRDVPYLASLAGILALLALVGLPDRVSTLSETVAYNGFRERSHRRIAESVRQLPRVDGCGPVALVDFGVAPTIGLTAGVDPRDFVEFSSDDLPREGTVILRSPSEEQSAAPELAGFDGTRNEEWTIWRRCAAPD